MQKTVAIYEGKCRLCNKKFQGTREMIKKQLHDHIENDCEVVKTLKNWEKKGIYEPMMAVYRREGLERDLKKLMKKTKSTPDELISILEDLQEL
ncbi:unnamed protein product [marine sediment metagenome]|uniref:Uncharacterized protein n=1 Tax=marine sediment metagenome TaxID=412755 RepID=X1JSQ5_9ZZZZ